MSEVIDLSARRQNPKEQVLICATCGCSTFHLRGDGATVCAGCNHEGYDQCEWFNYVPDDLSNYEGDKGHRVFDGNGDVDFTAKMVLNAAASDACKLVVAGMEDGSVRVIYSDGTKEDLEWLKRRLDVARRILESGNFE